MRYLLVALALLCCTASHAHRIVPKADVVLNVAPTGADNYACTTQPQTQPCATPQYAADAIYARYDLQCKYKATIQLAVAPPGEVYFYPGLNISGRLVGQCGTLKPLVVGPGKPPLSFGKYLPFTLQGDTAGANNVGAFINPGSGGRPASSCISLTDGAALRVVGIACDTTNAATDGFDIMYGSFMDMAGVVFGNAGQPGASYNNHINVSFSSTLVITENYMIGGSAWSHLLVNSGSTAVYENNGVSSLPFTVTMNPNAGIFTGGFVHVQGATLFAQAVNYVVQGNIVGPRAWIYGNGVVFTGQGCAPTYFPGNAPMIVQDNAVCK